MSPELDDLLCKKYPKIFKERHGDMRSTCMVWGFDFHDGWFNIVDKMCGLIAWDVEHNRMPEVVAVQAKEKFATLSFYYDGGDERTHGIVAMAERMSSITCEECGLPGKIIVDLGWTSTLCEKHAVEHAASRGIEFDYYNETH